MKNCSKCKIEKKQTEFHKGRSDCKSCRKSFYNENRNDILDYKKEFRKENLEQVVSSQIKRCSDGRYKEVQKDYYVKNKESILAKRKKRYSDKLKEHTLI